MLSLNNQFQQKKKRSKKQGRKKRKRLFEETKLGYFLKQEAPIEYKILQGALDVNKAKPEILIGIIESMFYSSPCPLFKKTKFRCAFIEFKNYGYYAPRIVASTAKKELYYINIRTNNGQNFIYRG